MDSVENELASARARIEALETTVSYQEQSIAELSSELYEHSRRIDRLEGLMKELTRRLKELSEGAQPGLPPNERPPHY